MNTSGTRQGVVAFLLIALTGACAGDDSASSTTASTTATTDTTDTTASTTAGTASASDASSTTSAGPGTATAEGSTTAATDPATATATDGSTTAATDSTDTDSSTTAAPDPALEALCLEVENALADGLSGDCACEVEAGLYPSVEACLSEKGISADAGACRCEIYAAVPDMQPYLECLKPIAAEFSHCITTLGCDDPDALDICYFGFLDAAECPDAVPSAKAETEYVCQGAKPFACGSGEEVPDTWLCDLEDDCMDGSDEADCPFFMCASGDEIPEEWECDGAEDCPDGDDEADCMP